MTKKKAVTKAKKTDVAVIDDSMLLEDGGDHGFKREDLKLPFVRVLQTLSPQLNKKKSAYIEDAEEGDFLNTATMTIYSGEDGILFVPAVYTMNYTEWKSRKEGGGLVSDHGINKSVLDECERVEGKDVLPSGNNILTSAMYYGYIMNLKTEMWEQAVLPMSSTQLKKSRAMNSQIQNYAHPIKTKDGTKHINPPMWFHVFEITTVPETNDSGDWMGLKIERHGSVLDTDWGHKLYKEAKELSVLFSEGKLSVEAEHLDAGEKKTEAPKRDKKVDLDDEIPF